MSETLVERLDYKFDVTSNMGAARTQIGNQFTRKLMEETGLAPEDITGKYTCALSGKGIKAAEGVGDSIDLAVEKAIGQQKLGDKQVNLIVNANVEAPYFLHKVSSTELDEKQLYANLKRDTNKLKDKYGTQRVNEKPQTVSYTAVYAKKLYTTIAKAIGALSTIVSKKKYHSIGESKISMEEAKASMQKELGKKNVKGSIIYSAEHTIKIFGDQKKMYKPAPSKTQSRRSGARNYAGCCGGASYAGRRPGGPASLQPSSQGAVIQYL